MSTDRRRELLARMTRTGLYLITDDRLGERELLERLERALEAGADVVQFRDKRRHGEAAHELGREVAARCRQRGALFIVNDDADLAVALDADGIHVGQDDAPPSAVRAIVGPERLIGLSVSAVEEAAAAVGGEADHLGFGALFPTDTKPDAEPAGPNLLALARRRVSMPIVGIGGITADNLGEAIRAGADCVAVVSAVFSASDPAVATRALLDAIARARSGDA